MADLKRYAVKYVRDKVKSNYPDKGACEICSTKEELHFHHFNSLAELWNKWIKIKDLDITTAEEVMKVREDFIQEHWNELVNLGACLCKKHHELLHKVYGKNPSLATADKQARWVLKQKEKKNATQISMGLHT
jgi:hypothetical protein